MKYNMDTWNKQPTYYAIEKLRVREKVNGMLRYIAEHGTGKKI